MRRKLVAGNWKMNGSLAANAALVAGIKEGLPADVCDVAVCVPAPYLAQVQGAVAGSAVALGAQDMSAHAAGAYTGEVSAAMLQEFGVQYVILGHSERRAYHGETDAAVAAKTVAALKAGLVPVVCVGETLEQREAGQTNEIVGGQLTSCWQR
jgi:triosephosphate isomerase